MDYLPPLSIPTWTSPHYDPHTYYTDQDYHCSFSELVLSNPILNHEHEHGHGHEHEHNQQYDTESDSDDDTTF